MSRIFAIAESNDENDNANYLVNRILDGAMNLSTNIISLRYVQKLHVVFDYSTTHPDKDDDFSDWIEDIRASDVFVIGIKFEGGKISEKLGTVLNRFFTESADLNLKGKNVIAVVVSDTVSDQVRDFVISIRERFVKAGMVYVDDLVYIEENGSYAKDNAAIDNKALIIGSSLRTNWRTYDDKAVN